MKCLIIEDEKIAAQRLKELLLEYDSETEIVEVIQSVRKSVEFFNKGTQSIDLIFMDIQLSDGLSFEIFEQSMVSSPIIFTTAYDEYALRAFKVNSIDYLLKPIDFGELSQAINKFKESNSTQQYSAKVFDTVLKTLTNNYKEKFVVKVGEHIKVFHTDEVQCFFSLQKATFLQTPAGRDYAINYSLDQVEELLDPKRFFRINRKYIVAFSSIKDIISYSNSRLLLKLNCNANDDLIISRERVSLFKEWLEK
ncbi:MAG TPA: DNA-binding response regulator [Bacteroidales bacterium]|jgi:two-component system response regulator LytT|nr:DNA-binding response regulator [Bacteroidales bacterium]